MTLQATNTPALGPAAVSPTLGSAISTKTVPREMTSQAVDMKTAPRQPNPHHTRNMCQITTTKLPHRPLWFTVTSVLPTIPFVSPWTRSVMSIMIAQVVASTFYERTKTLKFSQTSVEINNYHSRLIGPE